MYLIYYNYSFTIIKTKRMSQLLFLQDSIIKNAFEEIISCLTDDCEAYLVSGSVRNSLYYQFHNTKIPQRDYDIVLFWNHEKFVTNLQEKWWINNSKLPKSNGIVLKKSRDPRMSLDNQPQGSLIVLDITYAITWSTILQNLKEHANFTLNGSAINIKDCMDDNRLEKITTLPLTIEDIKNKQIRLNGKILHPSVIFACLRFMSIGFKKPERKDLEAMVEALRTIKSERFEKSLQKLYEYVWGESHARELWQTCEIDKNIFDYTSAVA